MTTTLTVEKPKKTYSRTPYASLLESPTDINHLLIRVLEHDDYEAFEKLFIFNYNSLRNFCKRLVHINEVAEELVSEVLLKIWINRKHITISSSPKSYLFAAVRNISFDHLRKEKRALWSNLEEAETIPCDNYDPHKNSEFAELQAKIEKAVERLPKQCRLVFQLSRDQGLKYNEIAEKLQLSVKTIETQMGRALKSLRISLKSE
jgi:RNA polymerase sigma-70 factor, ECF subfamily